MKNIKAVVNADDLGINRLYDAETFRLIASGKVSSATIIVNGENASAAMSQAKLTSGPSFGVHLNLTSGVPLCPDIGLEPILCERGCFIRDENRLRRVLSSRRGRVAVENELSAQIQNFLESGLYLSHIDSHHHVHVIPHLLPVIKSIQKRFSIYRVRMTINEPWDSFSFSRKLKKLAWRNAMRLSGKTIMTEGFCSLMSFVSQAQKAMLRYSSYEIMVHPGAPSYSEENNLLDSNWQEMLDYNITFVNYNQV